MAKIDSSLITATGRTVNAKYTYSHPTLRPYEKRAENRLTFILDQLDLGSDANLGYTKVTWLPDEFVQVRYLAMDGILQPIIVVRVEFQPGKDENSAGFIHSQVIAEEEEDEPPEEDEPQYIPFAWVGIHAGEHRLSPIADNINSEFWGWPMDPRLVAFEPTVGGFGTQRSLGASVESAGGALIIGSSWVAATGNGADEQKFFRVHGGQDIQLNQFGLDQGTFQQNQWYLTFDGLIASSRNNMLALEHLDTFVTLPAEALGSGLSELPHNYWKRSIIIPGLTGVTFPDGDRNGVIDVGGGVTATTKATYSGGTITSGILSGRYEIGAFAHGYHCESTTAVFHIRVVMGGIDPNGGPSQKFVYDFFPQTIANQCSAARMEWVRVISLGGNRTCGFGDAPEEIFGPNDGGVGWWDQSIYLNLNTGQASLDTASRDAPFFGGDCGGPTQVPCDSPDCVGGCDGVPVTPPSHRIAVPFGNYLSFDKPGGGDEGFIDLRGGVLWHMAQVTQVDVNSKEICFVELRGNDTAQGGSCGGCNSFSYGHTIRAKGYRGLQGLGEDLREVEEATFEVGEMVTVIGWTDTAAQACAAEFGDWRLLVTDPHGAGQDFTSLFWGQLRCPGAAPVDKYFKDVEAAFRNRAGCDGGPIGVQCGCVGGAFQCIAG